MQFTNRRGNGTYSAVVRRCPLARLDPVFETGATHLLNAMKAAACLLDLEVAGMRSDIRQAYKKNPVVLGIFPVAAYNGGPRNVAKLYRVLSKMKIQLDELSRPQADLTDPPVKCPCVWKTEGDAVRAVTIPRYNNENRWYIENTRASSACSKTITRRHWAAQTSRCRSIRVLSFRLRSKNSSRRRRP